MQVEPRVMAGCVLSLSFILDGTPLASEGRVDVGQRESGCPLAQANVTFASRAFLSVKEYNMMIRGKNLWVAVLGVSASVVVFLSGLTVTAQNDGGKDKPEKVPTAKKTPRQHFMEGKLIITQEILRGVVLSDFEVIQKNASALNVLTLAEEWGFSNTKQYTHMSEELRRITKQLAKAGQDKNIDAAALAYQRMTLNCVECHQALRTGFE